ncbi:MAG: diguanylate cyclase/phosphodiesterase (GGDEF & EAL domains) with PAS/PAC sensor(s) [uncultured Corynebacteriales bacterium]|uniref:Diguanylate cyclase/phosphodiesterase (GGDEF & EAL domains) with PAS/PAC sensor(S) n=1 Tax=uncultured Mycobacteriales bacterium TaxID=581187 RepID=A0A6J4HP69_9ACTN|nr:MAG: diguanylate cyclase/phosphodiesterase (GGDEF & EAL domains) with PAS/PAC sensor(s) [uncultured Corynebacteriales bacterium]
MDTPSRTVPDTTPEDAALSSSAFRTGRWVLGSLAVGYALATLIPKDAKPGWVDTWFYAAVLLAVVLSGLARVVVVQRDRTPWLLLILAMLAWSIGDIYWAIAFSDAETVPVPSPADVGYIATYPLAYVGMVLLARSVLRRVPASVLLDGLVTSLAVGALFSAFTVDRIISRVDGSVAEVLTNLSYPVGDLVLVVVAVATLAMVRWRAEPVWWLLVAGFGLFAVADTAYLLGSNTWYVDGSWVDGLWMLGIALIPLAGSLRRRAAPATISGFAALLVPILFSLAGLTLLVVGAFVELHPVTVMLAAACLVAAGARTALTFEQTRALTHSRTEAMTDELTTLGNRRVLDERLPALAAGATAGRPLLVSIVSIRHLAEINETLGYEYGDGLLGALGGRLREQLGDRAVPARLGGAEIAVLQPFDGHLARAEQSVRELLASLASPVRVAGVEVEIELSAGLAASPMHATDSRDLLRCAGDALRRAKATQSEVEIYDPAQDVGRDFGPRLLPELVGALEANRIVAWYQPKVDLATGSAVELEAVLRWAHPEHGVLDAEALRPLAARAGLTRRLTRVLLTEAVNRCAGWQRAGVQLGVSLDLTTADVLDSRLPYELARLVSEAGVPPAAIQLELAEDLLLVDPGRTRRALNQFRTLGVRLALDHYGRSAPSLTRLRTMPVQELKLDRSFVASVLQSAPDEAVVRSTVSLAQSLGIRTVADGVDTPELVDRVRSYGARAVQGSAVGEPMSPVELGGWLGTDAEPARSPQPIG